MTGKIKRRSLRCGGRPKADFGSIFTTFIAPALGVAGSVADSAIAKHQANKVATTPAANTQVPEPKSNPEPKVDATGNNGTTVLPPDPTKTPAMRLGGRKKCWIGAAIMGATSIAGSLFGAAAQKREMRRQKNIQDWQNTTQEAANMTSVLNNSQDYQEDYLRQFRTAARLGKTLGAKGIYITDGGDATKIGSNTYLLRGGSHEDVNETGQTGIGINVGGNEVEAEGGEVAQKKNGALRIFSAQPILSNGMSPAQAILRGYNKDSVFSQQQAFKKRNGLKDDGSAKYGLGGDIKGIWNFIKSYRTPVDNIAALVTAYQKLNPNSNYNKQKGKFKGGTFRGAGAGGTWTNDYKSNKGFDNFNDAYDDAVEHNAKTFIFGNKRYNTLKENNPIREINNRAVGSWRDSVVTKDRTGYGKDFGPIKGGASLIPLITETYNPKRIKHRLGGGLTSKDRGSSKHPYPSVSSKDFAGGGRSYPIPTKADAVDALRLAALHGRSDVKSKVYSRYPELRKKAKDGAEIEPYYDWARNTSANLGISFIDPTYDYRAYYDSVTPYERALIRFAPQGTHFTDIGKTPKHPTFSNESKYSNDKTPGGTWNGNVFVPSIWQFGDNGNNRRNKYMNNSGEGYFNGRVNVFPTSRKKHNLGGRMKYRIGGSWKAPVYNTNKYRVSNRMRRQIASWEGSDFAGQNRRFKGDAIGAKERELRRMMGRTYNYLNDNQRDSLNSIYYNSRVDTFKNAFGKWFRNLNSAVDRGDERAFNNSLAGIRQSMTVGENRKGMSGLAKRRAWERNWFGNPIPMVSNETKAILKQQAEAGMVQPTDNTRVVIQPEYIEVPAPVGHGIVPVDNPDPNLLQGNIKDNLINMGNKFRLGQRCGGSTRMRKALGGESRPVKGMRPKAGTGMYVPFNKRYTSIYDAPDYDYDYNGGNVLGNNEVTVTAKRIKPTFMKPNNDAMNLIKVPKEEVPYIPQHHNRSRTIFSGGDYLGLGIDTLAALSTGLVNYNTAGKYTLPDKAPIIQASKLPTTYNVNPEIEEVKRYRDRLTGQTFNNTSSSVAALNRSGAINLDALSNLSKLWATKENEENKMLTEDAKNQQTVAAQNVQNELARQSEIARIKNEAIQAKGDALNIGLSGLSQAWTNFWTAGRTAYEDDQTRRAMIASSKEATPTRLSEMDFDLSPDILASLYRTAKDDRTRRFYLSRLSPKQRLKYGIN